MSDPTDLDPSAAPLPVAEIDYWTGRYAQALDPVESATGRVFVIVRVAGERFALPMQALDEVASVTTGIALPHVSALVLGLANVRGEILPLLDTGALLGISASYRLGPANRTLVVRDLRGRRTGLPVDAVESVETLDPDLFQTQATAATTAPLRRVGVGEHQGRSLTLLDLSPLLAAGFNHF